MRSFVVSGISSANNFLILTHENKSDELPLQCFTINPFLRHNLDQIIGEQIMASTKKQSATSSKLRYKNYDLFVKCLKNGTLTLNKKELEESKLFSSEQKSTMLQIVPLTQSYIQTDLRLIKVQTKVQARLQYLSECLMIRFTLENTLHYLPIKMANLQTQFQCFKEATFNNLLIKFRCMDIVLHPCKYSAESKKYIVYATFPEQFEKQILTNGWATVRRNKLTKILAIQYSARLNRSGIFQKSPDILSFAYAKNNFVGVVVNVIDGYNFQILKERDEVIKVELHFVISPVGNENGAYESSDFARKNFIGQTVYVYLKKSTGLNISGSIIRTSDSKDIESTMLEQGWATVKEQFKDSILASKYFQIMLKAKQMQRGIFGKESGTINFKDLTLGSKGKEVSFVERRLEVLKAIRKDQQGIMLGLQDTSALNFKISIPRLNVIVKVHLDGIVWRCFNPLLREETKIRSNLKKYYDHHLNKRDVSLNIHDYNKDNNSFIGNLQLVKGKEHCFLQTKLLSEGFCYADHRNPIPLFIEAEQIARKKEINVFQANLLQFQPTFGPQRFQGKFSWIDYNFVFMQKSTSDKNLYTIWNALNDKPLEKLPSKNMIVGAIVVAPFQEFFYRALILSIKAQDVRVMFIDWGNQEIVHENKLSALPEQLLYLEPQCVKSELNLVRLVRTTKQNALQNVRRYLFQWSYTFQISGQFVDVYKGQEHINKKLIQKGLVKRSEGINEELKKQIITIEGALKEQKTGVWDEDSSESIEEIMHKEQYIV